MANKNISKDQRPSALTGILITMLLTSFVAVTYGFGFYLFAQLVTDMRADLDFGYTVVGAITAGGQLGFLAFALLGAWLAPRIGGGKVVIGSIALCGTCLTLLPLTDSIYVVGALLVVLGGTAASVYVPMVEIVGRIIAYEHRGKVLGLVSSGTSYGVFVNSLLVPFFVLNGNWRGVWYSVGIGTLVLTIVSLFTFWRLGLLRHDTEEAGTTLEKEKSSVFAGISEVIKPWVLILWAITFLNGFSTLPFQNYLSPYIREELGFTVDFAAQVWGAIGFIGMFSGFVVGWMSDKTGIRMALLFTYVSVFLSATILFLAPSGWLLVVAGVLFAIAFYPIFGLVPAYVAKTVNGGAATVIFGVANVTIGLGGMTGNYIAGVIKNLTGTFVWVYVVIAGTAVVLGVLSLILPHEGETERESEISLDNDAMLLRQNQS